MQSIGKAIMANTQVSGVHKRTKVLRVCKQCGKPVKMELSILGQTRSVTCKCDCDRQKQEQEERERLRQEREYEQSRNKKYSLMDEKARSAVFEKLTVTESNKKYIMAAENYCRQWHLNKRENNGLLFYGKTGRGKTTIACCIANRLLNMGVSIKAMSVTDMIQRVRDSFNHFGTSGETELKGEIKRADLLILDDLGAEYKTDWSSALVYEIIDARYRSGKPTIITTNLTISELQEHLTDSSGIPRAFDRLIEILSPVEFKGDNYRQTISQKKDYNFFEGVKE